ncbi:hypothetical protein [Citrobacter phage Tr1]|nr:hypothetical protein [Citrobacter phage Tr1]
MLIILIKSYPSLGDTVHSLTITACYHVFRLLTD